MELQVLSEKRGIYSIFNGRYGKNSGYIIYSAFYGVVAKSTKFIEDKETKELTIYFDICQWYGYWDLKSIVTKGIKKLENQFIDRKVNIVYNTIKNTDNSLNNIYRLDIKLVKRYHKR